MILMTTGTNDPFLFRKIDVFIIKRSDLKNVSTHLINDAKQVNANMVVGIRIEPISKDEFIVYGTDLYDGTTFTPEHYKRVYGSDGKSDNTSKKHHWF